jgi:ferritin-like protein
MPASVPASTSVWPGPCSPRGRACPALRKALGSAAVTRPDFDFGAAVQSQGAFTLTAITLEDIGVQAYGSVWTTTSAM